MKLLIFAFICLSLSLSYFIPTQQVKADIDVVDSSDYLVSPVIGDDSNPNFSIQLKDRVKSIDTEIYYVNSHGVLIFYNIINRKEHLEPLSNISFIISNRTEDLSSLDDFEFIIKNSPFVSDDTTVIGSVFDDWFLKIKTNDKFYFVPLIAFSSL